MVEPVVKPYRDWGWARATALGSNTSRQGRQEFRDPENTSDKVMFFEWRLNSKVRTARRTTSFWAERGPKQGRHAHGR